MTGAKLQKKPLRYPLKLDKLSQDEINDIIKIVFGE